MALLAGVSSSQVHVKEVVGVTGVHNHHVFEMVLG